MSLFCNLLRANAVFVSESDRQITPYVALQDSTRAYEHSGFVLRLILDGSSIKYEPDFGDFEVILLNVFDVMIKAVGVVPRIETKLYSEWVGSPITDQFFFISIFLWGRCFALVTSMRLALAPRFLF